MSYNSNLTRLNTLRKIFVHAWTCNLICVLLTLKSQMQNVFSFNTSVSYQSSTIQGIKMFLYMFRNKYQITWDVTLRDEISIEFLHYKQYYQNQNISKIISISVTKS